MQRVTFACISDELSYLADKIGTMIGLSPDNSPLRSRYLVEGIYLASLAASAGRVIETRCGLQLFITGSFPKGEANTLQRLWPACIPMPTSSLW